MLKPEKGKKTTTLKDERKREMEKKNVKEKNC